MWAMNGLSKGLNIDQDDLILICNVLTLHSHEVQSLGLVRIQIVWTCMWRLKAKVGCLPQLCVQSLGLVHIQIVWTCM